MRSCTCFSVRFYLVRVCYVWVSLDFACMLFDGMLQWDIFQSGHIYKDPPSFLVLGMVFF